MKRLLVTVGSGLVFGLAVLMAGKEPSTTQKSEPLPFALGAIEPRLSPDGLTIAVSYQGAIWKLPADGGVMSRLTDGDSYDHEPAWSPDGQRLAYVRGPGVAPGELRLVAAADGKPITLPKPVHVRGGHNYYKLEFHPDGKRLLGVFRGATQDHGLGWYDLSTGEVKPTGADLSGFARYALSPNGKSIIYSLTQDKTGEQTGNNGVQADLWKIPTDGGPAEKIFRFPARVHDLCYSANGKELFVVSDLGGVYYDIWQVPLANPLAGMKKLTFGQADEDRPSASRDGKHLVYTDNRDGATGVIVRDLRTGLDKVLGATRLDYRCPTGRLRLQVKDQDGGKPLTARVSLQQAGGKFLAPPGALYRILRGLGHFYCEQSAEWTVPAGKYVLRVYRGPEYTPVIQNVTVRPDELNEQQVALKRWTYPAKSGWYSGENHIHANYGYGQWYNTPQTMLAQCSGEDLNVCNFMVANSESDGVFDRAFFRGRPDPRSTAETILYWNQEFRSTLWGHMTLVNLKQVVEPVFTGFQGTTNPWDIPTNSDVADRTHWQKGHVNYTHPVQNAEKPLETPYAGKGLPLDVALGRIDSMDLNNSFAATVPIWHRFLNCGFRLPPSAGTDCFLNKIFSQVPGGERLYVKINGPLTYEGWIDGLRQGKSFVTNGPMLELTVDGRGLGEVIQIAGPRKLQVKASARSQFPLAKVELIYNGQVVATLPVDKDDRTALLDQPVNIDRSGWLALRASGPGHPDSPAPALFAHTAPIYLEVAGAPVRSRADAQFFLTWLDGLEVMFRTRDRAPTEELRQHVQGQFAKARAVYARAARD